MTLGVREETGFQRHETMRLADLYRHRVNPALSGSLNLGDSSHDFQSQVGENHGIDYR